MTEQIYTAADIKHEIRVPTAFRHEHVRVTQWRPHEEDPLIFLHLSDDDDEPSLTPGDDGFFSGISLEPEQALELGVLLLEIARHHMTDRKEQS